MVNGQFYLLLAVAIGTPNYYLGRIENLGERRTTKVQAASASRARCNDSSLYGEKVEYCLKAEEYCTREGDLLDTFLQHVKRRRRHSDGLKWDTKWTKCCTLGPGISYAHGGGYDPTKK
jgi:hypothetical protein